jgi:formamidopyrimidine-DNA glycosylase
VALARRGKYLLWRLEDEVALVMHLRMTGSLLYDPAPETPYVRVRIELDDGHRIAFADPRRFGTGLVIESEDELEDYFASRLGLEPLNPDFTVDHLRRLARGVRAPVKAFILDQRRIAGVGNIYADEALFRARIHPARLAGKLKRAQIAALRDGIVEAIEAGIAASGATISDFRDPEGLSGAFQNQFLVHRREGLPCPECATTIVKTVVGQRGTYFCPRCQPPPRRR